MIEAEIVIVDAKPQKCPKCNDEVVKILYGLPTEESFEKAEKGKLILGGCTITGHSPQWGCVKCGTQFLKIEK